MGTVLAWSGQHDPSIECNELALRMNPQDPANFFRHFGLAQLGRYDEAGRTLEDVKRMRLSMNASALAVLPFARASDREHLLDGLRKAGLSE